MTALCILQDTGFMLLFKLLKSSLELMYVFRDAEKFPIFVHFSENPLKTPYFYSIIGREGFSAVDLCRKWFAFCHGNVQNLFLKDQFLVLKSR